jgi:hypothetical protein
MSFIKPYGPGDLLGENMLATQLALLNRHRGQRGESSILPGYSLPRHLGNMVMHAHQQGVQERLTNNNSNSRPWEMK